MARIGFQYQEEEPEDDQPSKEPNDIDKATLEYFFQRFMPGISFKDSTHFLTTDQIYTEMRDHTGGVGFDRQFLHKWLLDNGYRFDNLEDMKIVWLLIEQ